MNRPLQVGVLPFDLKNPYQSLLRRELEALGARLRPMRRTWIFTVRDPWIWRADVLHLHWLDQLILGRSRIASAVRAACVVAQVAALRAVGVRIVWTRHNILNHERLHPAIEGAVTRLVARLASSLIVHCEYAKVQTARELSPRGHQSIAVVPHGNFIGRYPNVVSREESRRRLGIDNDPTVFLLFGGLRDYKGVPDLVQAFRRLEGDGVRLVVAGATRGPGAVEQLQALVEGDWRIIFRPGFVPDDEVQVFMNAADVVVLPYREILMSSVAMLALSFGRACLAPTRGCLPEVLDESCAFLYDDGEGALASALRRAQAGRAGIASMSRAARDRAERFTWTTAAALTMALYE